MAFARIEHSGGAVSTTLATDIASGDASLTLTAGSTWPTGATGPFYLVIDPATSSEEKILATARSTNSLTGLTRGVDGTSAAAHSAGAVIKHVFSASEADEANQTVHATLGAVTTKGDLLPATAAGALGRLAVGANNTVLTADSSQTTGQKWSTVASASLATGAVTTAKIAAGAVTTTEIADGTIATADIADGAITVAKRAVFPYCRLYDSTPTACPNNTMTKQANWDSELDDTDNMHSTVSNQSRITFNTAGVYLVVAEMRFSDATGVVGEYMILEILLNNTTVVGHETVSFAATGGGTVVAGAIVTATRPFVATDYIEVQAKQGGGSTLTPTVDSPHSPSFSASYLGKVS